MGKLEELFESAHTNEKTALEKAGNTFSEAKKDFQNGDIGEGLGSIATGFLQGSAAMLYGWTGLLNKEKPEATGHTEATSHVQTVEDNQTKIAFEVARHALEQIQPKTTEEKIQEMKESSTWMHPELKPGELENDTDKLNRLKTELNDPETISTFFNNMKNADDPETIIDQAVIESASSMTRGQFAKTLRNCGIQYTSDELDAMDMAKDKSAFIIQYMDDKNLDEETIVKTIQNIVNFGIENFENGRLNNEPTHYPSATGHEGSSAVIELYTAKYCIDNEINGQLEQHESPYTKTEEAVLTAKIIKMANEGIDKRQENMLQARTKERSVLANDLTANINGITDDTEMIL